MDDTKEFSLEPEKDRKFKISVKVDENRDDKYQELKSNNRKDYIFFNLEKTFNQYTFQASQQKIEQNIQK
ncbi:hypothetical protein CHF27_009160 [Romboutsia maritimum]|uniref:Uncharacterized protein n=1 Tax=Romboutsia maritimum TaxID=2020948 RepID=A0A371IS38_9FIRM|nr:hypothetical protein [Romboutsia maritimum]RDY23300.1 hypothetical protein CHF27_009160 [Romboutsia maritimum]